TFTPTVTPTPSEPPATPTCTFTPTPTATPTGSPTCSPPPSDLVGWWPGDGNIDDIVGGNNGTLQGNVTFASGMVGEAVSFDGNSYIDVRGTNLPVGNSSATISAWIKTTQTGEKFFVGWGSIIGCGPISNDIALVLSISGNLELQACGGADECGPAV